MSIKKWIGKAPAVKQVSSFTITANDVATTYIVTIGGLTVSVLGQAGGATATATSLTTALNASTDPRFSTITWTSATATVTGTADTAGVPFIATTSVSGGTGTISAVSTTTPSSGPNDWTSTRNWSDEIVPITGDTVIIEDIAVNIMWGLDQNAVDLALLTIKQSFTGKIGLSSTGLATSADGETVDLAAPEYRQAYLKIGWTNAEVGEHFGVNAPAGSARLKLQNDKVGASTTTVHNTASFASEINLAAVRLLLNDAAHALDVRLAPGGVAVAGSSNTETSIMGSVKISDTSTTSRVHLGPGVTMSGTWDQQGGNNVIQSAGGISTITVDGGLLQIEGDFTVTTMNINGGTVTDNHVKTAGNSVTTLNLNAGTLDLQKSSKVKTIATLNLGKGSTLFSDSAFTTSAGLPSGAFSVVVS